MESYRPSSCSSDSRYETDLRQNARIQSQRPIERRQNSMTRFPTAMTLTETALEHSLPQKGPHTDETMVLEFVAPRKAQRYSNWKTFWP